MANLSYHIPYGPTISIPNGYDPTAENFTVTYGFQPADTIITYVDTNNKIVKTETVSGYVGKAGIVTTAPNGYTLAANTPKDYTMTADDKDNLTVHVVANSTPNNNTNATGYVTPTQQESSTTPTQASSSSSTTTTQPAIPNAAAVKGAVVYATKNIYLYKHANFSKNDQVAKYPKAKRVNRPMFVVTDYARSKDGALRYKVRDVNHGSKTDGKTGYITANRKFVVPVYYASMPKDKQVTVISKNGANAYRNVNLTKKVKHYKKGAHLKVKKIVKHNLTSRYVLSNGDYLTGNKKLVIQENN
ncbi:hypothetical protein YK48G_10120 [Lentilactobacillus fungorum]|uniref:DUF5776 domain-containing protein n=1 Tax=Lentilactobacillus fungorum TaxID=2201250 RepID=A0ABQ3VZ75_9LACO|nr:DUF5776 domain-containing protein [Lentilactobacillus fungorum]GHP13587.1 hypothetical protein YK48G_10120 [Lentilactobacillus fungorum]